MIYIMIVTMGLVVFLNRYLFIEPRLPVRLNRGAREFLGFAVPGMLTAICGPIIFLADHQHLNLSPTNPYLDQRGGADVLDAQRAANGAVEHGVVLSVSLAALTSRRKKARGRAG
jgi:hypothetical protein